MTTTMADLSKLLEAAARSPFYASRLRGGRVEFDSLPLTTKQDLRDGYPFGMLAVDRTELATYHESSGTAGAPTPSYFTERDWVDIAERYCRKWPGITSADTFLVRTPYALMISGHMAHAAARRAGATVVPGDNRSLAMPYARVVRVLHDLGVTLTWSMPTETLLWHAAARLAGHEPGRDFPALRALFVGGEALSPAKQARISGLWNVPVVQDYGSTETGPLAGQCRHGRMHLWADRVIFEVYDQETGRIGREGRGQLVVTPLHREAMPLLRYNLEDLVDVSFMDCPCGSELPVVRVLGRSSGGYRVGERTITQLEVEEQVFRLPAEHGVLFWRARAEPAGLHIEIEVSGVNPKGAAAALTSSVTGRLRVRCVVDVVATGSLVPRDVLTGMPDVVKPRSLFGPDEDWRKALLYY